MRLQILAVLCAHHAQSLRAPAIKSLHRRGRVSTRATRADPSTVRAALVEERAAVEARLREIDAALGAADHHHDRNDSDFGFLSKSAGVYTDLKAELTGPP